MSNGKRNFEVMLRLDKETYDRLVAEAGKRDRKIGEWARTLLESVLSRDLEEEGRKIDKALEMMSTILARLEAVEADLERRKP